MELELSQHLFALGSRFREARGLEESTVGRMCASDGRFFSRLREGKTFTAKKYDEVTEWFSTNWPSGADWPDDVPRPSTSPPASENAA